MRKRSHRSSRWKHQAEINLNSFLDLILNVLLFFVFATEIAAFQALEVTVPSSQSSDNQTLDKKEIIVYITKDNKINVNGEYLNQAKFADWLEKNKNPDNDQNFIIVRGDLESHLQTTVDVLTACRMAKISKVKLETKDPAQH